MKIEWKHPLTIYTVGMSLMMLILMGTMLLPGCHQERSKTENDPVYQEAPSDAPKAKLGDLVRNSKWETLVESNGISINILTLEKTEYIIILHPRAVAIAQHKRWW